MTEPQQLVDLRVRRTHKLLWEALLTLMSKQEFEAISVKEICDQAMVHRTTFYKHYEDKYDLLKRGMAQMHELLLAELESFGKDASSYTRFFTYVATHEHFYRVMLCGSGVQSFQTRLRDYFANSIAAEMQQLERMGKSFLVPQPVLAHFYAGALVSTLTWWLSQDARYAPEQMGQYMRSLLGETPPSRNGAR
jgi:AcrR family transcriptional regulator